MNRIRLKIIQTAIALTAMVISFMPQKAEAHATCDTGCWKAVVKIIFVGKIPVAIPTLEYSSCSITGETVSCECVDGKAVCTA